MIARSNPRPSITLDIWRPRLCCPVARAVVVLQEGGDHDDDSAADVGWQERRVRGEA
jgi:hypothetical protein